MQLPAGTVEREEPPSAAVLCEITEETGVVDCVVLEYLQTTVSELPDGHAIVVETVPLRDAPSEDGSVG